MSLDTPKYLAELYSNIRARPVPWDAAVRDKTLTDSDIKRIKAIDKTSREKRISIVEKDANSYAELILGEEGVLKKADGGERTGIVRNLLVLAVDLLQDVPSYTDALLVLPHPFALLLGFLGSPEESIRLCSASVLTTMLSSAMAKPDLGANVRDALPKLYQYLATLSRSSSDNHLVDLAVQSQSSLLRNSFARQAFWEIKEQTLAPLVQILETSAGGNGTTRGGIVQGGVPLQLLYHVLLVVWELSFEESIAEEMNPRYDVIPQITDILRNSIKEKITRLSLAIMANLANKAPTINLPPLLLSGILPHLQTLATRFNSTSDPDITADLSAVTDALDRFQSEQTTLSSYRLEIMSGHLRWSPPHRNDQFWKKHGREIAEDSELLKALARVLGSSQDKTVLAVAANDAGVLVREVPSSRKRCEELGVKIRVMELMGDTDAEVRYEALKAVQGFLQHAFN